MRTAMAALVLVLALVMPSRPGLGHGLEPHVGVEKAWVHASVGAAETGTVYLTAVNHGGETDRLVGADTALAERATLQAPDIVDDIATMRPLEAIEVAPGTPTVVRPGGLHILLQGLDRPLRAGETFPLLVIFEHGGVMEVQVEVVGAAGGEEPPAAHRNDAPAQTD